jgi:hypothetical protein
MIVLLLIVVLAAPTALWFGMRARAKRAAEPIAERSGPRHRWWMP